MKFWIVRGECQGWVLSALSFQGRNTPWGNGIRYMWLEIIFFRIFYHIGIFNSPNKVYQGKRQNRSKIDYAFTASVPGRPAHYDRLIRIAGAC
ncbi:unnamed protein product [Macrosiphum euphorbiae]|uniref:Uncharacterized protein n=1 Tax=Macrosiphum euphorbiae TaxID=13131 RepID=A0AAV0XJ92_9HEMI|nr:unnamed protein product [Macrosiphum euphorbiae]